MPISPSREGLAKLYGQGRLTFFARFRRYSAETIGDSWRALLIHVMDENLQLVTDHSWVTLPKMKECPAWALPVRTPLILQATVSQYTRRTGGNDYCLSPIWTCTPLKIFPVETPAMQQENEQVLERMIRDKKYREDWLELSSLTCLPKRLANPLLLFKK